MRGLGWRGGECSATAFQFGIPMGVGGGGGCSCYGTFNPSERRGGGVMVLCSSLLV